MRHGNKINHLSRKYGHRAAMLSNMATSLIRHKRIFTTTAKAKELRGFIEPLITRAKGDTTHSRRIVFSYLQDKDSVKELFGTVAEKVGERPGGYTRILKTHRRLGDNAEMCMMELVDFNELMLDQKVSKKTDSVASKRTRRGKKKAEDTLDTVASAPVVAKAVKSVEAVEVEAVEEVEAVVEDVVEAEVVVEDVVEEVTEAEVIEEVQDEAADVESTDEASDETTDETDKEEK